LLRSEKFDEGDKRRMPLVVFGDRIYHQDHAHIKGHMHGVTSRLYRNLKRREKLGVLAFDIHEFRTSAISALWLIFLMLLLYPSSREKH
jgi:hypothetical protein